VTGDNAVGVQIDGDSNSVTIFAGGLRLVLDQPHKRRGAGAPANERQLLLTEWRATTLVGREKELAALAEWRNSAARIAVRCITGRAGSGKTRLAIEACEQAEADDWIGGFVSGDELRRFHAAQNLAQWRSPKDTLIVVDDAAVSAGILKEWFGALARRQARPEDRKLRILLLERHADADSDYGWWAELKRSDSLAQAGAGDLVGGERPVPLPIIAQTEKRRALLGEAMRLAAGFLSKPIPSPPSTGANAEFDRRLADDRLENEPLFLLMAGIVAADRGAPAALALGRIELAKEMAAMERARLARLGASRGLPADGDLIAHLGACATLQRGCDLATAKTMVAQEVAAMGFSSTLSTDRLVDVLAEALPAQGTEGIGRVGPDLIGEAFLVREVTGPRGRTEEDRLSILARALGRDAANTLKTMVLAAQDLAVSTPRHPAVRWLTELANRSTDLDELQRFRDAIPHTTLALRDLGAVVSERFVDGARRWTDDDNTLMLAAAFRDLASRRSYLGQREAAVEAAQEAVGHYRFLIRVLPHTFDNALASSLNELSHYLGELGEREEALTAAQEAVDLFRTMGEPRLLLYRGALAEALGNLASQLRSLGQLEAALDAVREGTDIYRSLAATRPDTATPDLAISLNNLANILSELGRREEAFLAAEEASDLWRSLAAVRPDAFSPYLALSLSNFSHLLREVGKSERALVAAREAVELNRTLAVDHPDIFDSALAGSLSNLANLQSEMGEHETALPGAQEAVALYRILATARPGGFNPDLSGSLNNLAIMLVMVGRAEEALAAAQEALDLRRLLAAARPDAFNPDLATSLSNVAGFLIALDRRAPALAAAQEAVDLFRTLAADRPNAFCPKLATALARLGDALEANGRIAEAAGVAREAIATLAPFFLASPSLFGGEMAVRARTYLRHAEAARSEPDYELLDEIAAKFDELEGRESDAD